MRRMEEELATKEKQLEAEKLIREKRLEIEQLVAQKRFQQEKELQEKRPAQERELQERRLAQEKEMLEKQLAEEIEFQRKQRILQDKFQRDRYQLAVEELGIDDGTVGGDYPDDFSEEDSREKVHDWLIHHVDPDPKLTGFNENVNKVPKVDEYQTPKRNPDMPVNRAINDRLYEQHYQSIPVQVQHQLDQLPPHQYQPVNRQFREQEPAGGANRTNEEVSSTSTVGSRDGSGLTRAQ